MSFSRIWGVMLRHLYLFLHSFDKVFDIFYWPTTDLVLWGLTSLFIRSINPGFSQFVVAIISGIIFWQVVWRGQIEVSVNVLEEIWNKNMIHLFASPLTFFEWILSFIALSILKLCISLSFVSVLAYIMYKVNIFTFGLYLVPFIGLLIMAGWCLGILVGAVILRYGSRVQVLAWSLGWLVAAFSAIYYPVSILPTWAQKIAYALPTSHIFEGMRSVIYKGTLDTKELFVSLILNIFFLIIAVIILRRNFRKVLEKGLIKVY
jgi:ABC-2 type transport system permease protein